MNAVTNKGLSRFLPKWVKPSLGRLGTHSPRTLRLPTLPRTGPSIRVVPKISVVVPSFNQSGFIRETLVSLLEERYPDLELIVVDGGSSDGTVDVIREFEPHIAWWVSEPDDGQASAINKGFRHSTGEIMAWLNSDDRIVPGALHIVAAFFAKHPEVDVVYGDRILIDADGLEIGRWRLPAHSDSVLRWVDFIPQETLYWRRRAWERVGEAVDESFQFAMDWDLLLRFARQKLRLRHLSAFMGLFRVHSAQKTSNAMISVGLREMERLRVRELGFSPTPGQVMRKTGAYLVAAKYIEGIHGLKAIIVRPAERVRT